MDTKAKNNQKIQNNNLWKIIMAIILALLVGIIVYIFTYQNTTISQKNISNDKYEILMCERYDQEKDDIITTENLISVKEELRATFTGDRLNDVSFTYYGEYDSEVEAKGNSANMMADFDQYMGRTGGSRSLYNPHHSYDGKNAKFTLYAGQNDITNSTKAIIFFDREDNPKTITIEELKSSYERSGFGCQIN